MTNYKRLEWVSRVYPLFVCNLQRYNVAIQSLVSFFTPIASPKSIIQTLKVYLHLGLCSKDTFGLRKVSSWSVIST